MNGDIRLVGKQRALQLLQKKPLAAYFRQRPIEYFVAASAQRHQRHVQFGMMIPQLLGHMFSLPDGQRGFSCCNSEFRSEERRVGKEVWDEMGVRESGIK